GLRPWDYCRPTTVSVPLQGITQSEAVGIHEVCNDLSAVAAAPAEFTYFRCLLARALTPAASQTTIWKTTPCLLLLRRSQVRAAICEDTQSIPVVKTIGMVIVAAFAATAPTMLPGATMTETPLRTRSAANSGSRSISLCAQRNSMATLRPS